jgi:hypothetical protein
MKPETKNRAATGSDVRRAKWQLVVALALVAAVMAVTMRSCPEDIRARTTEALHAQL